MDTSRQQIGLHAESLQPVLSDRFALGWQHVTVCACFAVLFMYLSYIPLFHTEIWRHVGLGSWMIENQQVPRANPLIELSDGMEYVYTSWLSQVILAFAERQGGPEALSNVSAIVQTLTLVLLATLFYRLSKSKMLAMAGTVAVFLAWWGQVGILRPQVFGALCLAILLWMLTYVEFNRPLPRTNDSYKIAGRGWLLIAIPALMAVWTNLDGSFVIGLMLMVCVAIGITVGAWWQTRNARQVFSDHRIWFWFWIVQLSLLATWINPQGVDYWLQLLRFRNNPILIDAGGLRPLTLFSWQGLWFGAFWALAIYAFRVSRAPLGVVQAMFLLSATMLVAVNALMLCWFAPIAIIILMPHLSQVIEQRRTARRPIRRTDHSHDVGDSRVSFVYSLICLLIVWVAFAFSPISNPLLGGQPRSAEKIHNRHTPMDVSAHFASATPTGLVWAPQYWGDWLQWSSHGSVNVFLNSDPQAIPQQVRNDYLRVFRGDEGWQRVLERYAVDTVVIDKVRQGRLFRNMLSTGKQWRVSYENPSVIILARIEHTVEEPICNHDG